MSSVIRLHPRAAGYFLLQKVPLWIFLGIWLAVVLGVSVPLATRVDGAERWDAFCRLWILGSTAFVVLIAAVAVFCVFKARAYRVELRDEGISLEYGVLNKSHEMILYSKVQDILVTRSILQRVLGLSTVVVQNAMGTPQRIPAMGAAAAMELRDGILRQCVTGGRL